jgi:hypothetical protein
MALERKTMNAKIESIEDARAALDEVAEFIGNWWPEHVVDEKGMTLLQKAYENIMGASIAVTFLKNHLVRLELEKGCR